MSKEEIRGQVIALKIPIDDALIETGFSYTFKPDYNLSEAEFKDLNSSPRFLDWFTPGIFLFGICLLLTCFSRYLAYSYLSASKVEPYEWIGGLIAIGISGLTFVIGYFKDNPKKLIMKKIQTHFSTSKPVKQFVAKRD